METSRSTLTTTRLIRSQQKSHSLCSIETRFLKRSASCRRDAANWGCVTTTNALLAPQKRVCLGGARSVRQRKWHLVGQMTFIIIKSTGLVIIWASTQLERALKLKIVARNALRIASAWDIFITRINRDVGLLMTWRLWLNSPTLHTLDSSRFPTCNNYQDCTACFKNKRFGVM